MAKSKNPRMPDEIPSPGKEPEINPEQDPEQPIFPEEPDIIPDEDPDETPPPFEIPEPGERP